MQKNIKISVLVFVLLMALKPVSSQTIDIGELSGGLNALRVGVPFLVIAPDSRAGALGDAGVASTPDVHSQHWNPAKYAFIDKQFGLSLSYTPWLRNLINDINLSYLAGYYRLDDQQVISGSLLYFSMGDITFTNDQGQTMTTHNPNEFAFDAAYSRKFADKIGGAIAFRYIRSDLTGGFSQQGQAAAKAGSSAATDVSIYYETPISLEGRDHEFALGLNISNIGNKISYNDDATKDFIPINMRLGGRFTYNMDLYNAIGIMIDANKLLVPTPPIYDPENEGVIIAGMDPYVSVPAGMMQSFYDAPGGFKEELHEFSFAVGLEYWYSGQFAIRAGYFNEHETKGNRKYFTIGAGLKYNVFNLDFAYLVPRA